MILGIDASNLLAGGGWTHLVEMLGAAAPCEVGFHKVVVWGGQQTISRLPQRSWLVPKHVPELDVSARARLYWRLSQLSREARQACDILFAPGGTYTGLFLPCVTMSRNMLPFQWRELCRFGWSAMTAKLWALRMLQTYSFKHASGVIFISEFARTCVERAIGRISGATALIPHGVSARFRHQPRASRSIADITPEQPVRVLYVSPITVYKHQWHVAEAVVRIANEGVPLQLELIGPIYRPAYRRLMRTLTEIDPSAKYVQYSGPLAYQALIDRYRAAETFVFASSCENMPNTLLEAMAAGLPIACSNRGPMPEVLGDAGVYFDPEVSRTIQDALSRLIESPNLRSQCAHAAYERALSFTWERCATETFKFLAGVIQ